MAHIKVVRRSMRPEEWTDLRFGWLKRYIYEEKFEIENLMVRDARQVAEMQYEFYPEGNGGEHGKIAKSVRLCLAE